MESLKAMLMSPDSSSADPDPITSSCPSSLSMIQVPECTQSHGGGGSAVKSHHIQVVDYKKIEPVTNGYMSPTKVHQPVFHQKPTMVPKSDEDLNLGKIIFLGPNRISNHVLSLTKWGQLGEKVSKRAIIKVGGGRVSFYYSCWLNSLCCFSPC